MEKYIYRGKLERVVDGDTIDALIDVGFDIWIKKRIRYSGIDTWESRTRDLEEKAKGLEAKARNKELLMEIIESAKVEALDELISEAEYWEMKAEVHFGL